ncbi:unnamed protein product [Cuscuta europaea]|uniref:CCHC-type domain-containing protein n=1 Tax=Cuscuta europaea TaxID=41803 RepID=A0A9P0ZQY4_CUSEU|nr:unnamed protein product [Cuscuta europaea]
MYVLDQNNRMAAHEGGTRLYKCFHCGEQGHWAKACTYKHIPCTEGCPNNMELYTSQQSRSYGCRFLRCKGQPQCQAFKWVDSPKHKEVATYVPNKETSSTSEATTSIPMQSHSVKVTVEQDGGKVTYEGQVCDVIQLMSKKLII